LIYVAPVLFVPDSTIKADPPFEVTSTTTARGATIYALPTVLHQCGTDLARQVLYWDTRSPFLGAIAVHAGSPNGPVIALRPVARSK
jgi:hypothetical protein